jgi:hypothetical protein
LNNNVIVSNRPSSSNSSRKPPPTSKTSGSYTKSASSSSIPSAASSSANLPLVVLKKKRLGELLGRNGLVSSIGGHYLLYLDSLLLNSFLARRFVDFYSPGRKTKSTRGLEDTYHETLFGRLQRLVVASDDANRARSSSTPLTASSSSSVTILSEISISCSLNGNETELRSDGSLGYHSLSMSSSVNSDLSTITEASVEPGQRSVSAQAPARRASRRHSTSMRRKSILLRVLDFNFLIVL